jgi:hypothetical protein
MYRGKHVFSLLGKSILLLPTYWSDFGFGNVGYFSILFIQGNKEK